MQVLKWIIHTTSINLNWSGFSDAQSGINHYEYSLGKQPNSGDLITRVNVGLSESVTINDLDLENNETYYSTIYAVDNVENEKEFKSNLKRSEEDVDDEDEDEEEEED